jgi:ABC-2 type transport system permease protein
MWAIVEREMRRFRRSPMLIVMALVMPLFQLVILGYAFGGNIKHLTLAVVDQDGGVPAVRIRELAGAAAAGAGTFDLIQYADQGQALHDLRNGRVNGVLTIPPEFSRRVLSANQPRVALISDNTDNFASAALGGSISALLGAYNAGPTAVRVPGGATLDVVEVYPYVPLHPVPAARVDHHVDLHDGDDRRRHHLHRRQGARPARGLPRHADHQARADRGLQHLRDDQGGARRLRRSC